MGFVSTNGFCKFYFKLPMNNFPSSQVRAKTCPRVLPYMPVKWVFRALERQEDLGHKPWAVNTPGAPLHSPGSTMA